MAQRGYNVTLFEKNSALALEASGNPQAILYANFFGNCPNNLELSYLGYNYSQTLIKQLLTTAHEFAACGIIQLAYKDSITKQQQQLSSQVAFKHILSPVTATEINIAKIDPKSAHAIVAIPDPKKGEQLILMTTSQSLKRSDISAYFKENQITELSVPKEIISVEKLPLLGTGKIDYISVKNLVLNANL